MVTRYIKIKKAAQNERQRNKNRNYDQLDANILINFVFFRNPIYINVTNTAMA